MTSGTPPSASLRDGDDAPAGGAPADPDAAERIRRRAAAGVLAVGLRGVMIRALGFLGNVVLARVLLPRQFGELALGFAIVAAARVLTNGGLGAALIGRREEPTTEELGAIFGAQLAATLGAVAIIAAIGLPLGSAGALGAVMSPLRGVLCAPG